MSSLYQYDNIQTCDTLLIYTDLLIAASDSGIAQNMDWTCGLVDLWTSYQCLYAL